MDGERLATEAFENIRTEIKRILRRDAIDNIQADVMFTGLRRIEDHIDALAAEVAGLAVQVAELRAALRPIVPYLIEFGHPDEPEYPDSSIVMRGAGTDWITAGDVRRLRTLLSADPPTRGKRVIEAADRMAEALDRCMVGGNHIASALIGAIGPGFAEEIASTTQALDALWGKRADTDDLLYEVWMCWAAIMEARTIAGGPDWLDAYRALGVGRAGGGEAG